MKLSELLQRRESLASSAVDLAARAAAARGELERIDAVIFARVKALASALEGDDVLGSQPQIRLMPEQGVSLGKDPGRPQLWRAISALPDVRGGRRPSRLEPLIIAALQAAGQPLSRNDLFDLLVERGVDVPGKDPRANLSAHLSNSDAFVRTADGLWSLKEAVAKES